MFGSVDCWASLRGNVRGLSGAVEKKAVIVCRVPWVPAGNRVGQPDCSRGLYLDGEQTRRRAAGLWQCFSRAAIGGSEASQYSAPIGVLQKQLVVHLSILCQKMSSFSQSAGVRGEEVAAIGQDW